MQPSRLATESSSQEKGERWKATQYSGELLGITAEAIFQWLATAQRFLEIESFS